MATAIEVRHTTQVSAASSDRVFLSANWRGLAMLNWECGKDLLQPLVPRGTMLDFHDGKTYVSLVGFLFLDTLVRGLPIPWHRDFEEVNLRFYVRREEAGSVKRAVSFIREIVPRRSIATVARWVYCEPYVALPMRHRHVGFAAQIGRPHASKISVEYGWRSCGKWIALGLECHGEALPPAADSHEEFIAEHYWGYCRQRDGGTVEYRVEHPPWKVWPAKRAWAAPEIATFYPPGFREVLSRPPDSAFLADGSAVRVFQPQRIA